MIRPLSKSLLSELQTVVDGSLKLTPKVLREYIGDLLTEIHRLKALAGWKKKRRLSRRQYLKITRDLEDIRQHFDRRAGPRWMLTSLKLAALALRNEAR